MSEFRGGLDLEGRTIGEGADRFLGLLLLIELMEAMVDLSVREKKKRCKFNNMGEERKLWVNAKEFFQISMQAMLNVFQPPNA